MSENKKTVAQYMAAFQKIDHQAILDCLTDDVIWQMPGFYHHVGKAAFDKEIENDAFEGSPTITVTRMIEEADIVVAEGTVKCKQKGGKMIDVVFCDLFHMQNAKIKQLTSYVMMLPDAKS